MTWLVGWVVDASIWTPPNYLYNVLPSAQTVPMPPPLLGILGYPGLYSIFPNHRHDSYLLPIKSPNNSARGGYQSKLTCIPIEPNNTPQFEDWPPVSDREDGFNQEAESEVDRVQEGGQIPTLDRLLSMICVLPETSNLCKIGIHIYRGDCKGPPPQDFEDALANVCTRILVDLDHCTCTRAHNI